MSHNFEVDRLQYFVHQWQKLTNDPHILNIVAHCHLDINVDDISHLFYEDVEYSFSEEEKSITTQEIGKLLDLKVIKQTHKQEKQIISPIFLWRKKDGDLRMILNLEKLNKCINYKHFKMENFEQAIWLVNKGDYMASVDLRHAYYSVKIAEEQKFLCFKWQGKIYHLSSEQGYRNASFIHQINLINFCFTERDGIHHHQFHQ